MSKILSYNLKFLDPYPFVVIADISIQVALNKLKKKKKKNQFFRQTCIDITNKWICAQNL